MSEEKSSIINIEKKPLCLTRLQDTGFIDEKQLFLDNNNKILVNKQNTISAFTGTISWKTQLARRLDNAIQIHKAPQSLLIDLYEFITEENYPSYKRRKGVDGKKIGVGLICIAVVIILIILFL